MPINNCVVLMKSTFILRIYKISNSFCFETRSRVFSHSSHMLDKSRNFAPYFYNKNIFSHRLKYSHVDYHR
jgi:hypothetical protein